MLLEYAQHLKPRDRRAALAPAFSLLMHGIVLALLILWMPRAGRVTPPKLISVELVEPAAQPVTEIVPNLSPAPPVVVHLQPLPLPAAPLAARTEKTANETSPAGAETPAAASEKSTTSAALTPISSEGVFDPGRPLSRQEPVYPDQAARRGLEGTVELRFTILADGRPDDIRVVKSEPAGIFDEAALRSQRTARYAPATKDGVAVDQPNCRVIFHFQAPR